MHFGSDGKLYVGVGDNANGAQAQNLALPFGKLLRFNEDGTIPTDNPFFATQSGLGRAVWAYGLRNPFTFAVQPGTGTDPHQRRRRGHLGRDQRRRGRRQLRLAGSKGRLTSAAGVTAPLFTYHAQRSPTRSARARAASSAASRSSAAPSTRRAVRFPTATATSTTSPTSSASSSAASTSPTATPRMRSPASRLSRSTCWSGIDGAVYVLTRGGVTRISAP